MTRETAKELLPFIKAFAEGKTLEVSYDGNKWKEIDYPSFGYEPRCYRIKPEQTYRPFKEAEECWQEMQKHRPFGWVRENGRGMYAYIMYVNKFGVETHDNTYAFTPAHSDLIFADGTPFGIEEK